MSQPDADPPSGTLGKRGPCSGRRALVTGGAGFIGSHLVEALLDRGCEVVVVDDLSTGRRENLAAVERRTGLRLTLASMADGALLERELEGCDLVFHLAAAVGVQLILDQPVNTIQTNVLCTELLLRAAAERGVRVVTASSSEVYGKGNGVPFAEDSDILLGPSSRCRWSYAASKLVGEFLALAYHRERALPVTVVRLFNTVGPRQTGRYGMVVPRFVGQALRGEPLTVYGDGSQSRCFLHVADAVAALLALADCPRAAGQVYNIGSTEEITILELARRVLAAVTPPARGGLPAERIQRVPYDQAYPAGFEDMQRRVPDVSKLHRHTGWAPRHDLDQVLDDVVAGLRGVSERVA